MRRDLKWLSDALRELHRGLGGEMSRRWRRSLPLEEEIFDRWERARDLGFGVGASIYQQSYVYGDVRVGESTWIGPFTILDGSGGLTIADHCSVSAGVQIYTHDTVKWALTGGKAAYEYAPVHIGRCCHIGAAAVIVKGVTIGAHSVIGASSFVNRDIPAHSVAVGVPARVIRHVEVTDDAVKFSMPATSPVR